MADAVRLNELREENLTLKAFLEHEGYRRCDIPACNCGSWHRWRKATPSDAPASHVVVAVVPAEREGRGERAEDEERRQDEWDAEHGSALCAITLDCANPDHQHYLDYLAALDAPLESAGTEPKAKPSA